MNLCVVNFSCNIINVEVGIRVSLDKFISERFQVKMFCSHGNYVLVRTLFMRLYSRFDVSKGRVLIDQIKKTMM